MKCNRCKVEKSKSEFDVGNLKCKDCAEYCLSYYRKNRKASIERAKKSQNKDRQRTNAYKRDLMRRNPVNYMYGAIKSKCKKYDIPFDLEKSDIVIPKFCPVLGIEMHISDENASGSSPSVDRIDPCKGYVKNNIHIISHKANTIKSNASLEELQKVVDFLKRKTT